MKFLVMRTESRLWPTARLFETAGFDIPFFFREHNSANAHIGSQRAPVLEKSADLKSGFDKEQSGSEGSQ